MRARSIAASIAAAIALGGCGLLIGSEGGADVRSRDAGGGTDASDGEGATSSMDGGEASDAAIADAEPASDAGDSGALDAAITIPCDLPTVTVCTSQANEPTIAWTGTAYALAWEDQRLGHDDVFFAMFDATGNRLIDDMNVSNAATNIDYPALAWNGAELGLVWREGADQSYRFRRISADGVPLGDVLVLEAYGAAPDLAWYGSGWAIVSANSTGVGLTLVDAAGTTASATRRANTSVFEWLYYPAVTTVGTRLLVAWIAQLDPVTHQIRAAMFDGTSFGPDVEISGPEGVNNSAEAELVWDGTGVGATWWTGGSRLVFAYLPDGDPMRVTRTTIGSPALDDPSIAAAGDRLAIAAELTSGGESSVQVWQITSDGSIVGSTAAGLERAESDEPTIAAGAGGWGVAWEEGNAGAAGIRLQIVCR